MTEVSDTATLVMSRYQEKMMLIRVLCVMHPYRVFTLKSTPLPPTFIWASSFVPLRLLLFPLPTSRFLFWYDNESIMCSTHSQLSNTQVRGEVDGSCNGLPQINRCTTLWMKCHMFFMLNSILNNVDSSVIWPRCLAFHLCLYMNDIHSKKIEKNEARWF